MKTKKTERLEKGLDKIAQRIYWNFDGNHGYSFQHSKTGLCMFVYDFDKDTFHEKELLKVKVSDEKYQIFKRLPADAYKSLGSTCETDKLYSYIKKVCNV